MEKNSGNNKKYTHLLGKKTKPNNFKVKKKENKIPNLPIFSKENKIIEEIEKNRVIIISEKTGCGKSTQVPQIIYKNFHNGKILLTQPHRIAAMPIAKRISSEMNTQLGELIGFHVSMRKKITKDTKIFVKTTGIFLEELYHNRIDYKYIIIDEVHERDKFVDLVLALLMQCLKEFINNDKKLILMSATISELNFAKYLKETNDNKDIPIIKIEEEWNIVQHFYIDNLIENLLII